MSCHADRRVYETPVSEGELLIGVRRSGNLCLMCTGFFPAFVGRFRSSSASTREFIDGDYLSYGKV